MEALSLLKSKIKNFVELVDKLKNESAELKTENSRLADENIQLSKKVEDLHLRLESFEGSNIKNKENLEKMSQEKALTKMVVDDLINSIDSLVEENQLES